MSRTPNFVLPVNSAHFSVLKTHNLGSLMDEKVLDLYQIMFADLGPSMTGFAKKIKSHAFCISGLKGGSNFDCTTLKYPMYELL